MNGIGDKSPQAPDAASALPCRQRYLMMMDRLFPDRAAPRPGTRDGCERISREGLQAQRARLAAALAAEAGRGIAGHWSFDANRLLALRQASDQCHALLDAIGPGTAEKPSETPGKRKNATVETHGGVPNSI
ncbi:hypothetical protein H1W37_04495 [Stappia taiwanensis]|uniref:Uncharacterized protein n=1 Tax=Stappia taiwanensis TaxID=992267 RepID=A0A838XQA5_9HYPH|nr:hypothetical protein [Stappia taiwanensis]MBA4610898.1 hypothetical protein [Stappia taiwanensis]GGE95019.1 hypothetical protein GCM10007285_23320 [Stappia taiwanensis]